MIYKLIFSFI